MRRSPSWFAAVFLQAPRRPGRYRINQKTMRQWKKRGLLADLPTGPKQPKATVLSGEEEAIVIAFRRTRCFPSTIASIPGRPRSHARPSQDCVAVCNATAFPGSRRLLVISRTRRSSNPIRSAIGWTHGATKIPESLVRQAASPDVRFRGCRRHEKRRAISAAMSLRDPSSLCPTMSKGGGSGQTKKGLRLDSGGRASGDPRIGRSQHRRNGLAANDSNTEPHHKPR